MSLVNLQLKKHSVSFPKVDEVRKIRDRVDELKKNFISVNEIKRELTEIKSLVNWSSSELNNIKVEPSKPKPRPPEPPAVTSNLVENSISDRSILVLGIEEHEQTLNSSERLEKTTAKNLIKKVDPSICSIEDVHRFSKFTPDHKPRPIVVTFKSQWDKRMALSKSYKLKNTKYFLKPMLTPEKRALEKLQLNLRFKLSNLGIPKHEMKILNMKLFHGNTVLDHSKAPDVLAKQSEDNWLANDFYVCFLPRNCRGMLSLEKRADLTALLHKLQPHFALLTKTWLDTTLENSDLSAGGSFSNIGRQDRIQGRHGGTLILQNTSNTSCAELLGNPVISNLVDFCTSALIKVDDRLVLFIVVYLPQGSLYEVTTTCLASVLHHGSTFLLNFNENIACEYRHICLLGVFNFPKTDWLTFSSSSARENSFLNILDDYEFGLTILSSTQNRGNCPDNILVPSSITGCFDCHVLPFTPFSDHAPISAKIYTILHPFL